MFTTMFKTATATRLRRILGSDGLIISMGLGWKAVSQGSGLTALSVHFNQESRHSHFTGRNGEVEEKDSDPREEKEVVQFADFHNDGDMVSQAVEDGDNAEDLCKHRK